MRDAAMIAGNASLSGQAAAEAQADEPIVYATRGRHAAAWAELARFANAIRATAGAPK